MKPHPLDLLAIFPAFESKVFGGVQASGREAWRSITNQSAVRSDAFYYEPGTAKLAALVRATARRAPADTVLVWHSGLLKLAPFIAASNKRVVLFLHGVEAWRTHDPLTSRLMKKTGLFLSNSDHTWSRFISLNPHLKDATHRTVHLGIGERSEAPAVAPHDPPAALMIGRLSRDEDYKGHREVIQAWPSVLASMPAAELWIVGGGDLRPELEQITQTLGLTEHVRFFGAIPDSQKDDLLQRCRAFVLPSTGEGFGLVYLEAMRLGRPCLVSKLDAGTEVVNPPEAGLSADVRNPANLAAAILRLLTAGPEWEAMSERARQRYETLFTAHHFEQRLLAALFTSRDFTEPRPRGSGCS
jgi:phosphatidyl-myo-inositol dimannoside synthase